MNDHKILLTGDFWHHEFKGIVSSFDVPVTLVPIEKVESVSDSTFDLIIIAQSRRSQFFASDVEKIQAIFALTPVVGLLGSWCEGEPRSGTPFPGVKRVYWHQWKGRYERFVDELEDSGITGWHTPKTFSVADQISTNHCQPMHSGEIQFVGISAWSRTQYEMVADAIRQFGWEPRWFERATWDEEAARSISAICVEADSWCPDLLKRIKWIRNEIPEAPIVLVLSYPRESEMKEILATGIAEVVSKPFELCDLRSAIHRSTGAKAAAAFES